MCIGELSILYTTDRNISNSKPTVKNFFGLYLLFYCVCYKTNDVVEAKRS